MSDPAQPSLVMTTKFIASQDGTVYLSESLKDGSDMPPLSPLVAESVVLIDSTISSEESHLQQLVLFHEPLAAEAEQTVVTEAPPLEDHQDTEQSPVPISHSALQKIIDSGSVAQLEEHAERCTKVLKKLVNAFRQIKSTSVASGEFRDQISHCQGLCHPVETIIGVVGSTGSGKTSLVHALLDEERLLPTSCMRASTAVITRLSYNHSTDSSKQYRAEISFISHEEWRSELILMFEEVLTDGGNLTKDCKIADTLAGQAYAKIKAVYPMTDAELMRSSVVSLMMIPAVNEVLGTTKYINASKAEDFYDRLGKYLDSGEKITSGNTASSQPMELWPLIREVDIHTKADTLSTGAVIVDLPGVHDSNVARAAIARKAMKDCTAFFIVSAANRALDDKSARDLLGESFERQLKLDNNFQNLSFVCTKCDDISIEDAPKSLGIQQEVRDLNLEATTIARSHVQLKKEIAELQTIHARHMEQFENTDELLDEWQRLERKMSKGEPVYAPSQGKKRRNPSTLMPSIFVSSKRRSGIPNTQPDDTQTEQEALLVLLTGADIATKIEELEETKSRAKTAKNNTKSKLKDAKIGLEESRKSHSDIEVKIHNLCIMRRNTYLRTSIKQKFAENIREMNAGILEQKEDFDPADKETRLDEDMGVGNLPVFCVSSRVFQQMSGHLQMEQLPRGFTDIEQTEIPTLQEHCKQLTENRRINSSRMFLNEFNRVTTSLAIWCSLSQSLIIFSDAEKKANRNLVEDELELFRVALEASITTCHGSMRYMSTKLTKIFKAGSINAADRATYIVARWNSPVNSDHPAKGGYPWQTYKQVKTDHYLGLMLTYILTRAICRRQGIFTNKTGSHDWNEELAAAFLKYVATKWVSLFSHELPKALENYEKSAHIAMESFHSAIKLGAAHNEYGSPGDDIFPQLDPQKITYQADLKYPAHKVAAQIDAEQKEASRQFAPVIQKHLQRAYGLAFAESGLGTFVRAQKHISDAVELHRLKMFDASCRPVKKRLTSAVKNANLMMKSDTKETFAKIRRDYTAVLTGESLSDAPQEPEWERKLKLDLASILSCGEHHDFTEPEARVKIEPTTSMTDFAEFVVPADDEAMEGVVATGIQGLQGASQPELNLDKYSILP